MVAFLTSLGVTALMVAAIIRVGRTRPVGKPLTWGEAFVAGVFVFALLFVVYGVVPHQWLAWADNELQWRSDKIGIPTGPLPIGGERHLLFPNGIPLPNGTFIVTAQVLRDIVATGLYVVFLLGHIALWLWWQRRGQKKTEAPELVSAYGRPLLKKA